MFARVSKSGVRAVREQKVRRTRGVLGGRSEGVVRRVLDAGILELARSGYAHFNVEAVATRAGVNKTTIYRRWPNRHSLVEAVVRKMREATVEKPLPDTGNVENDLLEAFSRRRAVGRTVAGRAWAKLMDERSTPEVDRLIRSSVDGRREEWKGMIERAIARQELPRRVDAQLVLEVIRAIVDSRKAARVDVRWLRLAVRTVLSGARAGTLSGLRTLNP